MKQFLHSARILHIPSQSAEATQPQALARLPLNPVAEAPEEVVENPGKAEETDMYLTASGMAAVAAVAAVAALTLTAVVPAAWEEAEPEAKLGVAVAPEEQTPEAEAEAQETDKPRAVQAVAALR